MLSHSSLQSQRGSALLVSLVILILLTIMTTVFLERIWTFNKISKGIEESNVAYYTTLGVVEEQLIDPLVTKFQPWKIQNVSDMTSVNTGSRLTASTGSTVIPNPWEWNSPFDHDYNLISLWDPIQLVIPEWVDWTNVNFTFRIPHIGTSGTWIDTNMTNSWIILWTLGYTWASLFASGETNIFRWVNIGSAYNLFWDFYGISNTGTNMRLSSFYNDITGDYLGTTGTNCTWFACTLKLSLIRPIRTSASQWSWPWDNRTIPFLEYKIDFGTVKIPNQYMILKSDAYAYWFFRSTTVKIPQITTNTALDFAILQ